MFLVGAAATLATVAPLFLGTEPLPSVFYWVCMLMGLGFLIAAAGVIRSATAQRRQAAAAVAPVRPFRHIALQPGRKLRQVREHHLGTGVAQFRGVARAGGDRDGQRARGVRPATSPMWSPT